MLRTRIIPCLLLKDKSLVKTVKFRAYNYIGDPINTVKIFNELAVDELMFLDIMSSKNKTDINYSLLQDIANECFMPVSYGGGIKTFEDARKIFSIGFEKIIINSSSYECPELLQEIASYFGSQSLVGSIDVKENIWGKKEVLSHHGRRKQKVDPVEWAKKIEGLGVGEILITSINRDGMWSGYDIDLIQRVSESVKVPVIANGGAGRIDDMVSAIHAGKASAVSVGSMVVYQKKGNGVLVNFPENLILDNYD